ncbi:hypothetical protein Pan44_41050 [Caulifigura coniformis]|uniref:Uncharacterized protein n=1 Tax=Caulifigura coniformis TaxID=2527983 RepID=A0A517SIW0_9PLAN|nr:hypothetical protein Pan44_41050 [Caulifigura coniformis]
MTFRTWDVCLSDVLRPASFCVQVVPPVTRFLIDPALVRQAVGTSPSVGSDEIFRILRGEASRFAGCGSGWQPPRVSSDCFFRGPPAAPQRDCSVPCNVRASEESRPTCRGRLCDLAETPRRCRKPRLIAAARTFQVRGSSTSGLRSSESRPANSSRMNKLMPMRGAVCFRKSAIAAKSRRKCRTLNKDIAHPARASYRSGFRVACLSSRPRRSHPPQRNLRGSMTFCKGTLVCAGAERSLTQGGPRLVSTPLKSPREGVGLWMMPNLCGANRQDCLTAGP